MEFSSYLRKKRKEKKMSIRKLATCSGVSPAYISQLENNVRKNPSSYVIKALCDVLGIDDEQPLLNSTHLLNSEIKERKQSYDKSIESTKQLENIIEKHRCDLFDLLTEENELYYKSKQLSKVDKQKVKTMLQTLLE